MKTSKLKIKKGLNVPITGEPRQFVSDDKRSVRTYGVVGDDYVGMKPKMLVKEGDRVDLGTPLFEDSKNPGVLFTSPSAGVVKAINRGEKRKFLSIEVESSAGGEVSFPAHSEAEIASLSRDAIIDLLAKSGQWVALRTRPFSKVPKLAAEPSAIFVNCMDTNPLAADPSVVMQGRERDFVNGLRILVSLAKGKEVFVCKRQGHELNLKSGNFDDRFQVVDVEGPHPAGLVGTHIHFLHPVSANRVVWHIGYQDVMAWGRFFLSGKIDCDRVVSVAGPAVRSPRLVKTRLGANVHEVVQSMTEKEDGVLRTISGSVLQGTQATEHLQFLGRYHLQISVLKEGTHREFLGWQGPGFDRYSAKRIYLSAPFVWKKFDMTTNTMGSDRAMVPVGSFEKVVPIDTEPNYLMRSLLTQDVELAQELGALELDEEDLALCTFVCPGKSDYGPLLRQLLTSIEKEG